MNDLEFVLTNGFNIETEAEKADIVDKLEHLLTEADKDYAESESPAMSDSVYDTLKALLSELEPDSPVLHRLWSEDEEGIDERVDAFLVKYPMLSIQTVKSLSDKCVLDFKERLPLGDIEVVVSAKENGHGGRLTYNGMDLVKARSRGRSTNGKDLLRQAKIIVGEGIEGFEGLGLVEVRGEYVLPFDEVDNARRYNPKIKNAFTGVSSMIKGSSSEAELQLLSFVAYDVWFEGMPFTTLSEKFEFLDECGFEVPEYIVTTINRRTLEDDIRRILSDMDLQLSDYHVFTDGVVMTVNDLELFESFGQADTYRYGNLALKMGRWRQDNYRGVVDHIEWKKGKTKYTPVAVLEEPVLTASGNSVTNIPLYAPCYILVLEAYPGNEIHFKYGGEAGVIPTTPDGRLVTDLELEE